MAKAYWTVYATVAKYVWGVRLAHIPVPRKYAAINIFIEASGSLQLPV